MATRIYRPDASRSWREDQARSSNQTVSLWLARDATDRKNKALKSVVTRTEQRMTLSNQRTLAFAKRYEVQGRGLDSYASNTNTLAANVERRTQQINALSQQIHMLDQGIKGKSLAGPVSGADWATYQQTRKALVDQYRQLNAINKGEYGDYTAAQAAFDRQNAAYNSLYGRYTRSTKRAKHDVNSYKRAVRAYNEGFYPV